MKEKNNKDMFLKKINNYEYQKIIHKKISQGKIDFIYHQLKNHKKNSSSINILQDLFICFNDINDYFNADIILKKIEKLVKKNRKIYQDEFLMQMYEWRCSLNAIREGDYKKIIKGRKIYPENALIFLLYMDYLFDNDKFETLIRETEKLNINKINNYRLIEMYIHARIEIQSFKGLYTLINKRIKSSKKIQYQKKFTLLLGYYYYHIDAYEKAKQVFINHLDLTGIRNLDILINAYHGYAWCLVKIEGKETAISMLQEAVKKKPLIADKLIEMINDIRGNDDDREDDDTPDIEPNFDGGKKISDKFISC